MIYVEQLDYLNALIAAVLLILLAYICYTDFRYRRIENKVLLLLIFFSVARSVYSGNYMSLLFACAFLVCGSVILRPFLAPGDIKLLAVLASLILPGFWAVFFWLTLFLGGVLAVLYLIFSTRHHIRERGLPYGVPICISGYIGILASL